jgi:molecular chaperone Hsp33
MTTRAGERDVRMDDAGEDNFVAPFQTVKARVLGRLVRLGDVVDTVLTRHDYAEPVSRMLGEALALSSLLGVALAGEGKFTLQTRSDGALRFMVVNFVAPGQLRGYASIDPGRMAKLGEPGKVLQSQLLGSGHLALTLEPGGEQTRYQGIVELDGSTLTGAAHSYFRNSEQLPTLVRLAVARHYDAAHGGWRWRAGGLLVQQIPAAGSSALRAGLAPGEQPDDDVEADAAEDWNRVSLLAATVEDHELTDPLLPADRLLYRLFHEEGVRVMPRVAMSAQCTCSRDRVSVMLKGFRAEELVDMREADGAISVTCEYCTTTYRFGEGGSGVE